MFAPGPPTDSHVPLATNKRSDHEPLGRPLGARPRHQGRRTKAAALVRERLDRRLERQDDGEPLLHTLELIDPLIDLAPIDKTPSTADLLEEGTPPSSPAPVVVSSPVVRNRAGSA